MDLPEEMHPLWKTMIFFCFKYMVSRLYTWAEVTLATGVQVVLSHWHFGGQRVGCSGEMGGWAWWQQVHWLTKWGRVWEISIPIKQCSPVHVYSQHSRSEFMNTSPCGWDFLGLWHAIAIAWRKGQWWCGDPSWSTCSACIWSHIISGMMKMPLKRWS